MGERVFWLPMITVILGLLGYREHGASIRARAAAAPTGSVSPDFPREFLRSLGRDGSEYRA